MDGDEEKLNSDDNKVRQRSKLNVYWYYISYYEFGMGENRNEPIEKHMKENWAEHLKCASKKQSCLIELKGIMSATETLNSKEERKNSFIREKDRSKFKMATKSVNMLTKRRIVVCIGFQQMIGMLRTIWIK